MAEKGKNKTPWPTKSHTRGGKMWVPHPSKKGWEINVMDMTERKGKWQKPKVKK